MKLNQIFNSIRIKHLLRINNHINKNKKFLFKNYYKKLIFKELLKIFGYSKFFLSMICNIFDLQEIYEFLTSNEKKRPLSIRINSLKKNSVETVNLIERKGIKLHRFNHFNDLAFICLDSSISLGSTTEYLCGYYTLQSISSLLPVISLNPTTNEKILDLAAAPGNKSTLISQFMRNNGILISNDIKKLRIKSLVNSIHRLNIDNSIIANYDGILIPFIMKGFHRVLLDAPCSGSGLVSHDPLIKKINKHIVILNSNLQKRLLIAAIDACNGISPMGNIVVYSTCSISVEENECVIQYVLSKRNVEIISTGIDFGLPGLTTYKNIRFDENMKKCKRFYPHVHNVDGFFICKLRKKNIKI